jgi:hypothetical protein
MNIFINYRSFLKALLFFIDYFIIIIDFPHIKLYTFGQNIII